MALTKHQLIHHDIRAKITRGDLPPGAPLPSQQELMAAYGVAQGTVRQALDRLQADGLVTAQRGKGTFVSLTTPQSAPSGTLTIGVAAIGNRERFTILHDHMPFLQQVLHSHNCELAIRFFSPDEDETILQWARKQDGVLIWSAASTALVQRMVALNIPVALLGELADGPCPSGVNWIHFNVDDTLALAVSLLKSMNHRHIWFISRRGSRYYDWCAQAFIEQARIAGLGETARFVHMQALEDEPNLIAELKAADVKPTAILIEGDVRASRFVHILERARWSVPDRLSVMAIGASDPERVGIRDLYRVLTPPDIAVERSVDSLVENIRTGRVVRHIIAPRMSPGKTCVPIPERP